MFGNAMALWSGAAGTMIVVGTMFAWTSLRGMGLPPALVSAGLACVAGVTLAVIPWISIRRRRRELQRIVEHIQQIANGRPPTGDVPHASPYHELTKTVTRAVTDARDGAHQLEQQQRALQVELRIKDLQRQRADAILDSLTEAVIVTDAFHELVTANEAAARLFALDLANDLCRPIDQVIADPTITKHVKDTVEGGNPSMRRRIEHAIGAAGRAQRYEVTSTCLTAGASSNAGIRDATPGGASVVTVLRNVTRESRISEMKSEFVSNVSHELRTPLSSIKAYVEMLVDGEADNEITRAKFYHIIYSETNRLARLIDNILNISRVESGGAKVQRERMIVTDLIKEVIDVMLPQARAKHIELLDLSTSVAPAIFADRDMIYQVLINLVGNAIKYTPEDSNGQVTVTAGLSTDASMIQVAVRDNGVGIASDAAPHVFDKFYRVPDHKTLAKGTGLGLNLVRQIIETVHDGVIGVESTPGAGSTFTFALPFAE